MKSVKYGDIKKGDVIIWYGAKEIVDDVYVSGITAGSERIIRFSLSPMNEDSIKILGNYYSHGTYGGIESLEVALAE